MILCVLFSCPLVGWSLNLSFLGVSACLPTDTNRKPHFSVPRVLAPSFPQVPRPYYFLGFQGVTGPHTVDGRNPEPPKKPWNDDFSVNINQQWLPMVSMVRTDFVHPQGSWAREPPSVVQDRHPPRGQAEVLRVSSVPEARLRLRPGTSADRSGTRASDPGSA